MTISSVQSQTNNTHNTRHTIQYHQLLLLSAATTATIKIAQGLGRRRRNYSKTDWPMSTRGLAPLHILLFLLFLSSLKT